LKVIATVARGTNWPLRKVEEEEEEDEQVVEHASPISKCFSTVPVGQQQEEVAEVPSSYRISRRTRSVVSVSLVWLTCTHTRRQGHFIVLYEPIPITQGESLFFFLSFISGTRGIHFRSALFSWSMPLPLNFFCFINKRTGGYFMFPGTATAAVITLQRPTKNAAIPKHFGPFYNIGRTSYRYCRIIFVYMPSS
jgi:hypothetical protein